MGWVRIWGFAVLIGLMVFEVLYHCELCHIDAMRTVVRAEPVANATTHTDAHWVRVERHRVHTTGEEVVLGITFPGSEGARDGFEVTAKSQDEHVAVGVGVKGNSYSASFKPRLAGVYEICIFYYWPSSLGVDVHMEAGADTYVFSEVPGNVTSNVTWCKTPPREHCFSVDVAGLPQLPSKACPTDWEHAMEGSWLRSPEDICTTGYCEGDLRFQSTDRWVWVPYECYLRLYNREAAWNCLDKKSVLWFGDSTLKQPATNMLEMILGVPVLDHGHSFNWYTKTCAGANWSQAQGCPTPFALRRWSGTRTNPHNPRQQMTVRYIWGGAKTVDLPPPTGNRKGGIQLILDEVRNKGYRAVKDLAHAVKERPDYIFVNTFAWYPQRLSWEVYIKETTEGLTRLLNKFPYASLHFDTSHAYCTYDKPDHDRVCESYVKEKRTGFIGGHNSMLTKTALIPHLRNATKRSVTVADRFLMSQPYSVDNSHCHFGLHYGSHRSFCNVFTGLQPAEPCVRDWKVDKFEMQIWLNKMCAVPPVPSHLNIDIEQGVP